MKEAGISLKQNFIPLVRTPGRGEKFVKQNKDNIIQLLRK